MSTNESIQILDGKKAELATQRNDADSDGRVSRLQADELSLGSADDLSVTRKSVHSLHGCLMLLSLYHNCDSTKIRLRYDCDTTTTKN